jgi:hypothetical protein
MTLLVPPPSVLRPELRVPLARVAQSAFELCLRDLDAGAEVPFVIDERGDDAGPALLYAYRPLFRAFLDERRREICRLDDYRLAMDALRRDPSAVEYAMAHAAEAGTDDDALRTAVLWPLLVTLAERGDGFVYDDAAFDAVYGAVERSVVGTMHRFEALAPVTGLLVSEPPIDLGDGLVLRRAGADDIGRAWPETQGLLPSRFGLEPDRMLALELAAMLDRRRGESAPDAQRAVTDAVSALRLVSGGPIAAGPLVFERLDASARAVVPLPASAATPPPGEPVRLDAHRLSIARALRARLGALPAGKLRLALTRHEQALSAADAHGRADGALQALAVLLDPPGDGIYAIAMRAAALQGDTPTDRGEIAAAVRGAHALVHGLADAPSAPDPRLDEIVRAVLMSALLDDRGGDGLPDLVDEVIIGARPRPRLVPAGTI